RGQLQSAPTNSHDCCSLRRTESRAVPVPTVRDHLYAHLVSRTPESIADFELGLQITRLAARRSKIPNPKSKILLHSSLLRRPAAVVGQWGDVLDAADLQAGVLEVEDRLLAPGAGAFHFHFDFEHAVLARLGGGAFGGSTRGERRALARAFE